VTQRTGAGLDAPAGIAALALRRNPRRAHLLVSLVLGKHVPVPGAVVLRAAAQLGGRVRAALEPGTTPYVLGFAETATGLGHGVAAVCGVGGEFAPYAHTTRRPLPGAVRGEHFFEEHSHAVDQALGVLDDRLLRDPATTLVIVDDELSSGRTAVNAIRVLHRRWPRARYLLACLLDVRSPAQRAATSAAVADLGADLVDVCLAAGRVDLPADLPQRVAPLLDCPEPRALPTGPAPVHSWELRLPDRTPLTGAFGWDAVAETGLRTATDRLAAALRRRLSGSVLVLGDEEFLYAAQLTAAALGPEVRTSSTTRSPALVVDAAGYPLRSVLRFPATDDSERVAFAYNVAPSGRPDPGTAPGFDSVVLLADRPVRPGLVRALAGAAGRDVHIVQVQPGRTGQPAVIRPP
jgi:hypothetical protein